MLTPDLLDEFHRDCEQQQYVCLRQEVSEKGLDAGSMNEKVQQLFAECLKAQPSQSELMPHQEWGETGWIQGFLATMSPLSETRFSDAYILFWYKLEMAHVFLHRMIFLSKEPLNHPEVDGLLSQPIPERGHWGHFVGLTEKYGVVSLDAFPSCKASKDTFQLNQLLFSLLRKGARAIREEAETEEQQQEILIQYIEKTYRILEMFLGRPPNCFEALEFCERNLRHPRNLVGLLTDSRLEHSYGIVFELQDRWGLPKEWNYSRFLNLPIEELSRYVLEELGNGFPVWVGADSQETSLRSNALSGDVHNLQETLGLNRNRLNRSERLDLRNGAVRQTVLLTGAIPEKNLFLAQSVHIPSGFSDRRMIVDAQWFSDHVYQVYVPEKVLSPEHRVLLNSTGTLIPPGDPLGIESKVGGLLDQIDMGSRGSFELEFSIGIPQIDRVLILGIQKRCEEDFEHTKRMGEIYTNGLEAFTREEMIAGVFKEAFSEVPHIGNPVDQGNGAVCWLHASLNIMRQGFMEKYNLPPTFALSATYLLLHDKLEKADAFLKQMIALAGEDLDNPKLISLLEHPAKDIGEWDRFAFLVGKYGVVPGELCPDTPSSLDTSEMNKLLYKVLHQGAAAIRRGYVENPSQMDHIHKEYLLLAHRLLVTCLGMPPTQFNWGDEKDLTPLAFAKLCASSPNDFVVAAYDPHPGHPFGMKHIKRIAGGSSSYINLKMEKIMRLIERHLDQKKPLLAVFDCNKQCSWAQGVFSRRIVDTNKELGIEVIMDPESCRRYKDTFPGHFAMLGGKSSEGVQVVSTWGTVVPPIFRMDREFLRNWTHVIVVAKEIFRQVLGCDPDAVPSFR